MKPLRLEWGWNVLGLKRRPMWLEHGEFGGSTVLDKLADVDRSLSWMINCMVISLHMVLDLKKKKKVKIFFGHRLVVQTIAVIETKTVSLLGSLAGSQRKQHLVCGAGSCQRARLRKGMWRDEYTGAEEQCAKAWKVALSPGDYMAGRLGWGGEEWKREL